MPIAQRHRLAGPQVRPSQNNIGPADDASFLNVECSVMPRRGRTIAGGLALRFRDQHSAHKQREYDPDNLGFRFRTKFYSAT